MRSRVHRTYLFYHHLHYDDVVMFTCVPTAFHVRWR